MKQNSDIDIDARLEGFDDSMTWILNDWNCPGFAVGIVIGDELVFTRGYGYRDYEQKLPFTPNTLFPIASNTKLFTAIAAGMVVEEGKLTWDKPVAESVPTIRFHSTELSNHVTLRDMLSHRTGITRHDSIWYKSDFTRQELFERLQYLEPQAPFRTKYLYNNLLYAAAGYLIELQTGKIWEEFVQERILTPLKMNTTLFDVIEMQQKPDIGVPFTEHRDSFEIYRAPYYEEQGGICPAGGIVSNIEEMSHWLAALMNEGKYAGNEVISPSILQATMEPAIAMPNAELNTKGYGEILNSTYGMGRQTSVYRGHLLTYHGGAIGEFFSQVSFMPQEKIGVIVFVIGRHASPLRDVLGYHIYERLLGIMETPWSTRRLEERLQNKKADTEKRATAGADRIADTKPSHALADYVGEYENEAYGILTIGLSDQTLEFDFHHLKFLLYHFHYDRFDTPDDDYYGKFSVLFTTNPQGDIDTATIALDEADVIFTRKPEAVSPELLNKLTGEYILPNKGVIKVIQKDNAGLFLLAPPAPEAKLIPVKGLRFRHQQFSNLIFEFVRESDSVTAVKQISPQGEQKFPRKTP